MSSEAMEENNCFISINIEFKEIGHGIKLFYLPKRESIKVINFKNVEV